MMSQNLEKKVVGKRQIYRRVQTSMSNIIDSDSQDINLQRLANDNTQNEHLEHTQSNLASLEAQTNGISKVQGNSMFEFFETYPSENLPANEYVQNINNQYVEQFEDTFDIHASGSITESICLSTLDSDSESNDLLLQLRNWVINDHVPHSTVNNLLQILSPHHPELPLDCRTLIKSNLKHSIILLNTGEYCHLGLSNTLRLQLLHCSHMNIFESKMIKLTFNIDGIPLFKSSNTQLWPILCQISNKGVYSKPFAVGVFCGKSKPALLYSFLEEFIEELKILLAEGLNFNNIIYNIEIEKFVCDAPARAFLKCVKSHGGYSSCDKCTEPGEYIHGRVILRGTSAPRRTDDSFLHQMDEDHHIGNSPLLELHIGLVSTFPNDYMHSVCLGVTRKLLNSWVGGNLRIRLSSMETKLISSKLSNLKKCIPREINRKPRELSELSRWKATEYRTFLLYLGPVVLKHIVPQAIYEHFLLLHCGIVILVSPSHISKFTIDYAEELLNLFVNHCEHLYGAEFLVYNVHSLCHLGENVKQFGPLDAFSAFCFENYLGYMKSLVKSPYKPLQQVCSRLTELKSVQMRLPAEQKHLCFEMEYSYRHYKKIILGTYCLTLYTYCAADSYCLMNNSFVVQIQDILKTDEGNFIKGKRFISYYSLFEYPVSSIHFNVFVIENLSDNSEMFSTGDITSKCIVLAIEDSKFVSFPLLHTA